MPPKTEDDLPVSQKVVWLKASSAMELKNFGYAIQLLQGILKSHPDFLPARSQTDWGSGSREAVVRNAFQEDDGLTTVATT